MGADKPGFTLSQVYISFRNLRPALTHTLYFPTLKGQAGFESVLNEIVMPGLAIAGDDVSGRLFRFLFSHWFTCLGLVTRPDYKA